MGFSIDNRGKKPNAIAIFPVDFSDTGNFSREGLAEDWVLRQLHELGYDRGKL